MLKHEVNVYSKGNMGTNNPIKVKYIALVVWVFAVVIFFLVGMVTQHTTIPLITGFLAYVVFLVFLLVQLRGERGLRKQLGILISNIGGSIGIFVVILVVAVVLYDSFGTSTEPVTYTDGLETIECYVKGTKVYTDRESCKKLSEETVVEKNSEVRYVPVAPPARPKISFPEPEDLRQTCTKCDTNYAGQVVCQTYKAFICY